MSAPRPAAEIGCVEDLLHATRPQRTHDPAGIDSWLYRGQVDGDQPLIASAGRIPRGNAAHPDPDQDLAMFRVWRSRAPFYQPSLPDNDWEALAVAAHHGLATRLLDWSLNPLVALFFCVHDAGFADPPTDGALFVFQVDAVIDPAADRLGAVDSLSVFFPAGRTHRVIRQRGAFTYHPRPWEPMEASVARERLLRYRVPAGAKRTLRKELDRMGVNMEMLFPDLEGFSSHLNWVVQARRREQGRPGAAAAEHV